MAWRSFALLVLGLRATCGVEPEVEQRPAGGSSLAHVTSGDATAAGVLPYLLPFSVLLRGLTVEAEAGQVWKLPRRPREVQRAKPVVRRPCAHSKLTLNESIVAELRPDVPWVDTDVAQRLLAYTDGDMQAAKQKLREGEAWRKLHLAKWQKAWPLPDGKDLSRRAPDCRVIADGKDGRQMLYGSARNQIKGESAEQWALAWDRALAGRPGDAQIDFVMDAHGYNGFINLDPRQNFRLVPAMDSYFAGRVKGFYVLDFPRVAESMWNLVKGKLPKKTVQSIHFLRTNRPEDMQRLDAACGSPEQARMLQELLRQNRVLQNEGQLARRARTRAFTDAFLAQQRRSQQPAGFMDPFRAPASGRGAGDLARGVRLAPRRLARRVIGTLAAGVAVGAEGTARVARGIARAQKEALVSPASVTP